MKKSNKNVFCAECGKWVNYHVEQKNIREYEGLIVNVKEKVGICNECGNEIFIYQLDNNNLKSSAPT